MTTNRPFLGESTDREKAFPNIEILEIMIVQDPYEQYARYAWQRESRYTKVDIPRRLACLNPRCQQGGLDLQQIVSLSRIGQHSYCCGGHEIGRAHVRTPVTNAQLPGRLPLVEKKH